VADGLQPMTLSRTNRAARSLWIAAAEDGAMDEFKEFDDYLRHVESVNLSDVTVPPGIIEMVPEPIARENVLIPIAEENGVLRIVVRNPSD